MRIISHNKQKRKTKQEKNEKKNKSASGVQVAKLQYRSCAMNLRFKRNYFVVWLIAMRFDSIRYDTSRVSF